MDDVLVGTETADDAGVVRLQDDLALVTSVDFITPLVDEPLVFGAIAAANSISDIYAMGARAVGALSIACYPARMRGLAELGAILRGGVLKLGEANTPVIGGHTVEDPEVKIGYAVFGTAPVGGLWRNSTAQVGDVLLLTKPLGTGILAAAARARKAVGADWDVALASMARLNKGAAEAVDATSVHAATDITGFGLLGHAMEVARGSGVTLRIRAQDLPLLAGALKWARAGCLTRAATTNREYVGATARVADSLSKPLVEVLYDAQTSGGLLLSVASDSDWRERLAAAECPVFEIGRVEPAGDHALVVE